jgi:hypothetical protein
VRLHAETLVRDIRARVVPAEEGQRTEKNFRDGLQKAWATGRGLASQGQGIHRFSLIVLGVVSDCHEQLSDPSPELEGVVQVILFIY